MNSQHLRTAGEAKAWLDRHGVSATEWARKHGFEPSVVFSVLSGRTRGRRGQAHSVAVALHIKEAASDGEDSPLAEIRFAFEAAQERNTAVRLERNAP